MGRSILEAARELFATQGPRKTTLEDIARRMGRTKTFVYHYFASKDDILRALIETEGDEYERELEVAVADERTARGKLRAYVVARFRIFARIGTFYSALRERYYEQYAFIEKARRKYDAYETESMAAILAEGSMRGELVVPDVKPIAHAILVALKGYEIEWATESRRSFEKSIDILLEVLFDGIAKDARRDA